MKNYKKEGNFDIQGKVRSLIYKLAGNDINNLLVRSSQRNLLTTYTLYDIKLSTSYIIFNLNEFHKTLEN
jgi:hypothetical protein